jgi:hypothetical protein
MLILRHVDPHETPRLFNLRYGLISFTIKIIGDLLREFCLPYSGAAKEKHNEGTIGIDPAVLA